MSRPIRAVTYNVHSCIGLDGVLAPDRVLAVLREIDADIVALQELGQRPPGAEDQFARFGRALGMDGAYDVALAGATVRFGNALFVRGAIVVARVVDLSVPAREPRRALDATVDLRGKRLRVIATHLGWIDTGERRRQVAAIGRALAERPPDMPTLVLGDFNLMAGERRELCRIGAPRVAPRLPSWPANAPSWAIDHLWTVPNAQLRRARAHASALAQIASDHLPVVGELQL